MAQPALIWLTFALIQHAATHSVVLERGVLQATRDILHGPREQLQAQADEPRLWILCLERRSESGLLKLLSGAGAVLLASIWGSQSDLRLIEGSQPNITSDQWLIKATRAQLVDTLIARPSGMVAELPPHFKLPLSLDPVLEATQLWLSTPPKRDSKGSGPLPEGLQDLTLSATPEGFLSVTLVVQGTTDFLSLASNSTTPSARRRLFASGEAWGAHLIEGLRVALAATDSESAGNVSTSSNKGTESASSSWGLNLEVSDGGNGEASVMGGGHGLGGACTAAHATATTRGGTARVTVCIHHLAAATSWLSQQNSVQWLGLLRSHIKTSNLLASAAMQGEGLPPLEMRGRIAAYLPYWEAGLDGRGQLMGITDDGLDPRSCYFFDPRLSDSDVTANASLLFVDELTGIPYFKDLAARKLTHYFGYADFKVQSSHGTHTSTTAVGACYGFDPQTQPDLATGVAPAAKLAFFDIGAASDPNLPEVQQGTLSTPTDLEQIFELLGQQGVHVVSNSWVANVIGYDATICNLLDAYLYKHQDLLLVFASGNNGAKTSMLSQGTTSPPANCKNTLAVGATHFMSSLPQFQQLLTQNNTQEPLATQSLAPTLMETVLQFQVTLVSNQSLVTTVHIGFASGAVLWDGPRASFKTLGIGILYPVVLADPEQACGGVTNSIGKVVIFVRGACFFYEKALATTSAGAVAGIIYDDDDGTSSVSFVPYAPQLTTATAPFAAVPKDFIMRLRPFLQLPVEYSVAMQIQVMSDPLSCTAPFSSFGATYDADAPNQDLRIKPEIMAPGYLRSGVPTASTEKTMDACATSDQAGTSMATPLVAGAALLVRQWFTDGWYPSGAPNGSQGHLPSAQLIKAVLLGGTVAMTGIATQVNSTLTPPPSPFQGFGRLSLLRSLPLANSSWNMQVVDRAQMSLPGENHTYTITVTGRSPLSITLCWADYPTYPGTPQILVNDLNLLVVGPSTRTTPPRPQFWLGNTRDGQTKVQKPDSINTVEKVYLQNPAPGLYIIVVFAARLFILARPCNYSLVVLGGIQGHLDSPWNPV